MPSKFANTASGIAGRLSARLGPGNMRKLARINKYVTNPIQRLWAPRIPNYAIVEHIGRKSGRTYQTPVMLLIEGDTLSIALNYGTNSDWVRNIQSAGTADIIHRGRRYRMSEPRITPPESPGLPATLHGMLTPAAN